MPSDRPWLLALAHLSQRLLLSSLPSPLLSCLACPVLRPPGSGPFSVTDLSPAAEPAAAAARRSRPGCRAGPGCLVTAGALRPEAAGPP
eukprot:767633-Hanusia_phi.AAC.5